MVPIPIMMKYVETEKLNHPLIELKKNTTATHRAFLTTKVKKGTMAMQPLGSRGNFKKLLTWRFTERVQILLMTVFFSQGQPTIIWILIDSIASRNKSTLITGKSEKIWRFPKMKVPPNHPFSSGIFHHKPSILGYPHD